MAVEVVRDSGLADTRMSRAGLIHYGSLMARRLRWLCRHAHDLIAASGHAACSASDLCDNFAGRTRYQTHQASMPQTVRVPPGGGHRGLSTVPGTVNR